MIPIPPVIKNILLIRLGAIGDVVQTLPTVEQLKINFPEAKIHWAIESKSYPIVEHHPGIEFHIFPKEKLRFNKPLSALLSLNRFRLKLQEVQFDLAIDLQGLMKSGLVAWMSNARKSIGFHHLNTREGNSLLLDTTLPPLKERIMHRIDFYQQIIEHLGGRLEPLEDPFAFTFTEPEQKNLKVLLHRLRIKKPFFLLNLGASKQTKRWTSQGFANLIKRIQSTYPKHYFLLTGAGKEDSLFELEILKLLPPHSVQSAVNKTSLRELALLTQQAAFLISGDSLALHLGSAFKTPSIGLFGGSALAVETGPYWAPYPGLDHKIPCYPCRKRTCSHHSCMVNLSAEQVFQTLLKLYKPPTKGKS
ncbi:glycosyltransferase family 9 protein [bacterium]|jgi:heptosyltransferase I|nr:glycosyltransferase family 9 protein [bacterium]